MILRSRKTHDLLVLILPFLFILLLVSCQPSTQVPPVTPTPSGRTPRPRITLPATATEPPAPTATESPALGAEASELDGVTVDFWHPWQADLAQRAADAANQFNRENEWGIKVRVRSLYSSGALLEDLTKEQEENAAREDDAPEVLAALSDQLSILADGENGPVDLEAYLADPESGLSEGEIAAYHPVFWAQDRQGEKRLGIPALRTANVLFYNQTWAKELGFQMPPPVSCPVQGAGVCRRGGQQSRAPAGQTWNWRISGRDQPGDRFELAVCLWRAACA